MDMLCVEYWSHSHFSHTWPGYETKYWPWPCVVVPIGWYNLNLHCVFCSILGAFSIIASAIAKKQVLSHKVRNCWLTVTNLWVWVVDPFSKHWSGVHSVWSYWRPNVEHRGQNWSVSIVTWTFWGGWGGGGEAANTEVRGLDFVLILIAWCSMKSTNIAQSQWSCGN